MAFNYAGLTDNVVVPALEKFGTAITYRSFSESFNPSTGENTRTPAETAAFGIVADYKAQVADGTLVQAGDKRILTARIPEPKVGDELDVGSVTYRVVAIAAIRPAGTAVVYELQVRA